MKKDKLTTNFTYKKEPVFLNPHLINKMNLKEEDIQKIIKLHKKRIDIENKLVDEKNNIVKFKLLNQWTSNQFQLQEAWGFEKIQGKHTFWNMKGCTCPKIDNEDNWNNNGPYFYNTNCPIHNLLLQKN